MKTVTTIAMLVLLPLSALAGDLEEWLNKAARAGNLSGVKQLIARGVYVPARDEYGSTALMWAAFKGHDIQGGECKRPE